MLGDGTTDKTLQTASEENATKGDSRPAALVASLENALSKVPDTEARTILSLALSSRTSFGFGPDADSMKIMAETEMHQETCQLQAYQASLSNRDKQSERDHDFRRRKLNHQSLMSGAFVLVTICGVGAGLYLAATGNTSVGTPVLIASATLLSTIGGRLLPGRDKD
jgi:hypothetical protein